MLLNLLDQKDTAKWQKKGYELPTYDREQVKAKTLATPTWIHFGAGNIFRGFPAALQQTLLSSGKYDKGIIVCEGYDYEIIEKAYKPFDDLSLLVVLKADGTIEKKVIGSVVASYCADSENAADWQALTAIFENPSLQMVSFTITEKGYSLADSKGDFFPFVKQDFVNGLVSPIGIIAKLTALLYKRFQAGQYPLSLVSMDNCSHNGEKLQLAVLTTAKEWLKNELVPPTFVAYIENPQKLAFPWTMIDKITPRPDEKVKAMLDEDGFEPTTIIRTQKNTYTAPFVNAEQAQYLVIEDLFPNGRPPLQEAGVIFTDRDTVNMVEKMKVCTCLNPLHTALAVAGCLLGYKTIFEEMGNPSLRKLVERIGYVEGMPVVVSPGIIDPMAFIKEVLEVRLPNPFMPDAPQRIATDTSQKLSIRYGETIKAYVVDPALDQTTLEAIPFVFALWCRYLMGIDDNGKAFEISPDPMLGELRPYVEGITPGTSEDYANMLAPILKNAKIFGVDLYEVGLAEKVNHYYAKLVAKEGAVKETLDELVANW